MLKEEVFWRIQCKPPRGIIVPSQIVIHVTSSCPNNCMGCYSKRWTDELDLMLFEKIIREGEKLGRGYTFFGISGGEPLVRTDIWEVIALHSSSHFIIYTSGVGFWRQVSQLKKLSNIFIFFSSKVNSQQEETGENLEQILNYCRKSQLPFGISLLVTQENVGQVSSENYLQSWLKMGAQCFLFMCFRPFGGGEEFGRPLGYKEVGYLLQRVEKLRNSFKIPIMRGLTGHGVTDCRAGSRVLSISPSGEIQLCPFAPVSLGNIRSCSLEKALRNPICRTVRLANEAAKLVRMPPG